MPQPNEHRIVPRQKAVGGAISDGVDDASETLTALLATDLEASTEALVRLGDARARRYIQLHDRLMRAQLDAFDGMEVCHMGDGILASFRSVRRALACARSVQLAFAHAGEEQAWPMSMRIGVHAGEPLALERRLVGVAVNTAVRICDRAPPGTVYASDVVKQLAVGGQMRFVDQGMVQLKGLPDEHRLYAVHWPDEPVEPGTVVISAVPDLPPPLSPIRG